MCSRGVQCVELMSFMPRRSLECSESAWPLPVSAKNTSSRLGEPIEKSASSMPAAISAASASFAAFGVPAMIDSSAPSALRWTLPPRCASSSLAASSSRAGSASATCRKPEPVAAFSSRLVPSAIFLPLSMTAMRAASWSASSRYCVVSRMVTPAIGECADHAPDALARIRIEAGRRLVEEEHARRDDERCGDVEPPPHAAGIGLHLLRRRVGKIEGGEQLVGAGFRRRGRESPRGGRAAARFSRPVRSSSSEANWPVMAIEARTSCGAATRSWPITRRRARIRRRERRQHAHQRRLAGAVRAEDGEDHAARNVEVDPVDGAHVAEALDQAARGDGEQGTIFDGRQTVHRRCNVHDECHF